MKVSEGGGVHVSNTDKKAGAGEKAQQLTLAALLGPEFNTQQLHGRF